MKPDNMPPLHTRMSHTGNRIGGKADLANDASPSLKSITSTTNNIAVVNSAWEKKNKTNPPLLANQWIEVKKVKTEVIHLKNRLLPNAKEQILLKITNDDQKPFDGEMLASMHDISAENMLNNHHDSNIWNFYTGYFSYSNALSELYYDTDINGKSFSYYNWNTILDPKLLLNYPQINTFGYSLYDDYYVKQRYYNSIKNIILITYCIIYIHLSRLQIPPS